MNIKINLVLNFFILILMMACSKDPAPEEVYKDYLASIQSMKTMADEHYKEFITVRAKAVVSEKIKGVEKEKQDLFLQILQAEAVIPKGSEITLTTQGQNATLSVSVTDYPEKGSKQEQKVSFIREGGWKIDKIVIISHLDNLRVESSTF